MKRRAFIILVGAMMCVGCSVSSKSDSASNQNLEEEARGFGDPVGGEGAEGGIAFPEDSKDTPTPIDYSQVTVLETVLDPPQVKAGYEAKVLCAPMDVDGNLVDVPTYFQVEPTEELFYTSNQGASFEIVGTYGIRCYLMDDSLMDDNPASLEVIAGDATVVETEIDVDEIVAGDKVHATCTAYDAFGNLNEWAHVGVNLSPGDAWVAQGTSAKVVGAGTYDVACTVPDTGAIDLSPETLVVVPGVPETIQTLLSPYAIEAGSSSALTCRVLDHWNNPIDGFPISIMKPQEVVLSGMSLQTVVAGIWPIKCVPATDPWEYYDIQGANLQVLPGPPAEIYVEQVPPKPVYQKNDTVDLLISVLDDYANVIPDAPLKPLVIEPESGIKVLDTYSFKFQEEGKYTFGIISDEDPDVNLQLELIVDGQGPAVVIETPARGATLGGKQAVTVEGVVQDDFAGVYSLELNGQEVDVKPDGTFSHIILANHGMNILRLVATDLGGAISTTSRAFYYSGVWHEADAVDLEVGAIDNGLAVWMGQDFLDDGDHSAPANDVASLLETLMADFVVGGFIQNPVASAGPYDVLVSNTSFSATKVSLDAFDGGLALDVNVPNFKIDLDLKGSCKILFVDLCPDFSGDVSIDKVVISADILASENGGEPQITVTGVNVELKGLDLDINGILGWLFDFIIDWLVGFFVDDIEDAFEDTLSDEVADLFQELLENFAIDIPLELDPLLGEGPGLTVALDTELGSIQFEEAGGLIGLDAVANTQKVVAQKPLGSIGRAACLTAGEPAFAGDPVQSFGIALHDDVINRLLFSMWWGGLFNFQAPLGDLVGSDGVDFLPGLTDVSVKSVFFAAPIITSCNPAQVVKFQIADAFFDVLLTMDGGLDLQLGFFTSFEAEAQFAFSVDEGTGEQELGLEVFGITDAAVEIVSISAGWEGAKAEFEALIYDELLEGLMEGLTDEAVTTFPIPSIDVSSLLEDVDPDTSLSLELQDLMRAHGNTIIYGKMQ